MSPFLRWTGARCVQGTDCLGVDHAGPVFMLGFCRRCWGALSEAERALAAWEHDHVPAQDDLEAAWRLPCAPDGPRDLG